MNNAQIINSFETSVSCVGKDYPYDHPKVYLEIDPVLKEILCPYCGKKFELISKEN